MRFSPVATFVLCLLLAACSGPLQEPTPGVGPEWANQPWRVHCETANTLALDIKAVRGIYDGRWTWAEDAEGDELTLRGYIDEGFFHLQQVLEADGDLLAAEPATLRKACIDTLERDEELAPLALGQVQAARHSEDIDVPILYPDQAAAAPLATRLVVFGDSLSDTGKLKHRMQVFPRKPYWLGRFSNGPAWPDYLEAATPLAIQNHSYGGASVARLVDLEDAGIIAFVKEGGRYFVSGSLQDQVESYLTVTLASEPLDHPDETVYLIWAGANDYVSKEPITGLITTFLNDPDGESGYRPVADETISELSRQVELLHSAGARRFLLLNLPDLGRTPIVLQNETYESVMGRQSDVGRRLELARRLTALTDYHNAELANAVERLNTNLAGATVLLVDSRKLTDSVLDRRAFKEDTGDFDYGFALEQMNRDLEHGDRQLSVQQQCYTGAYMGSLGDNDTCDWSDTVFFWDTIHPATYAHCWMAYHIGHTMAEVGWLAPMLPLEQHKAFCRSFAGRDKAQQGITES